MAKAVSNPKLFRELSEPFPSNEAADKAIGEFFDELGALREKHKLPNVYVIIGGSMVTTGGEESEFMTAVQYGDSSKGEMMTAWAVGREQIKRQEIFGELLKGVRHDRRPR